MAAEFTAHDDWPKQIDDLSPLVQKLAVVQTQTLAAVELLLTLDAWREIGKALHLLCSPYFDGQS
jgi:hypothetical protein